MSPISYTDREQPAVTSLPPTGLSSREAIRAVFIRVRSVVCGAGVQIPSDGILIEASDLYVRQAALTGESLPVEKSAAVREGSATKGPESPALIFLGTSVVSGTGTAVI